MPNGRARRTGRASGVLIAVAGTLPTLRRSFPDSVSPLSPETRAWPEALVGASPVAQYQATTHHHAQ